jgi:hypothetical protein
VSLGGLRFALFVLVTGVLFLRPADIFPDLENFPVYELSIWCCLAVSMPAMLQQLSPHALRKQPITLCVLGLLVAVPLSYLVYAAPEHAFTWGFRFFKVALSYLLMVHAVNTTARLRLFLGWLALFILILTALGMLQYFGVIDYEALSAYQQNMEDSDSGSVVVLPRLCGAGIFGNPNDLSRIIVVGMTICLYGLSERSLGALRYLCVAPLGFFGYALTLTYSRGGFIGLLVTLMVLFQTRFGTKKMLALVAIFFPILFAISAGRQTEISNDTETAQSRIRLWSDGFQELRSAPLFGIGMNRYTEITGGLVAHNSFVQAYVELGFVGGTLFTGAVAGALWFPYRLEAARKSIPDPQLLRLRPYVLAIVAGYAAGMLSSTRCYAFPTYYFLGLAAALMHLAAPHVPARLVAVSGRVVVRLVLLSAVFLAGLIAYVLLFVKWG